MIVGTCAVVVGNCVVVGSFVVRLVESCVVGVAVKN